MERRTVMQKSEVRMQKLDGWVEGQGRFESLRCKLGSLVPEATHASAETGSTFFAIGLVPTNGNRISTTSPLGCRLNADTLPPWKRTALRDRQSEADSPGLPAACIIEPVKRFE